MEIFSQILVVLFGHMEHAVMANSLVLLHSKGRRIARCARACVTERVTVEDGSVGVVGLGSGGGVRTWMVGLRSGREQRKMRWANAGRRLDGLIMPAAANVSCYYYGTFVLGEGRALD
jgi:hypothetical protein